MKTPIFEGSGVAIVTPFANETVDLHAMKQLLEFQLENGTDAIIVCGTTGEAATMSYRERMRVMECCVDYVSGRVPVIAGSGSNSTESAVALSRDAERTGVDGLLVVTPYYNKATQQGLIRHYHCIADAVQRPIILYNVPSRTGVNLAPETYAVLAEHPRIVGVKEASGNLSSIQKIRQLCPEDFYIWSGNDGDAAAVSMLGGKGVISVAANIMPREMHQMMELCRKNDFAAAGALQLRMKDLCDALFCEVNPIPVKTALNLMGLPAGELRLPLCEPSPETVGQLRRVLAEYHLLSA